MSDIPDPAESLPFDSNSKGKTTCAGFWSRGIRRVASVSFIISGSIQVSEAAPSKSKKALRISAPAALYPKLRLFPASKLSSMSSIIVLFHVTGTDFDRSPMGPGYTAACSVGLNARKPRINEKNDRRTVTTSIFWDSLVI